MTVRKVVTGSILAAGIGVAGLFGAGMASADVTDNPTTNDSNGFGVTNHMKNGPAGNEGPTFNVDANGVEQNGIGWIRSTQTGDLISDRTGVKGRDANLNGIVTDQGNWGPINDNGGKNNVKVGNGR